MTEASAASAGSATALLVVDDLSTHFVTDQATIRAVDHVSFELRRGETLGLIGESGCGKSITTLSIMRLVPGPSGRIVGGRVVLDGVDLLDLSEPQMRKVRGGQIGLVFQDPTTSLNPTKSVGDLIAEPARIHLGLDRRAARARAAELLTKVGIANASRRLGAYPHEFSGGMRQRVAIAMALAGDPSVLLADEPTTALDVTIQLQILELIRGLSREFGLSVLLVTHDLGVAAGACDRISVMYAGRIVETGPVDRVLTRPAMPYSRGLLDSTPRMDVARSARLLAVPGKPPDLALTLPGCRFAPRCQYSRDICSTSEPQLVVRDADHLVRCFGSEEAGWIPSR